jgi:hypothetical protein
MQNYTLVFFSIFFLAIHGKAQNIELYHENKRVTTDTIEVFGNVSADTLQMYTFQGDTTYYYAYEVNVEIDIHNTSASSIDVQCKKRHVQLISETQNYFCWSSCYPPYTFESINPVTILANETNDIFSAHYKPNGNLGCIVVAYTFFNNDNPSDSAMVVVKYIMSSCNPTAITEEYTAQHIFSLPYPNPASTHFFVDKLSDITSTYTIQIYNSMGKLISIQSVNYIDSRIKVSTEHLNSGYYFYRILIDEKLNNTGIIRIE